MYNFDKELVEVYFDITLTKDEDEKYSPDEVVNIIKNRFKSNYVVVEKKEHYQNFIDNLNNSDLSQMTYEDEEVIVFEL